MMKKNKAHDANTYSFQHGERFLFDANIWLYLHPPTAKPTPGFARGYGSVLKRMISSKAELVLESLVLSEYMNRYWKVELAAWQRAHPADAKNFIDPQRKAFDEKKFRLSPHFKPIGQAAIAEAKLIFKRCSFRDTPLQLTERDQILSEFAAGTLDFNDGVLVETCRLRGWKMVTHDKDMTVGGIDVITTNPKLLAACP